MGLGGGCHWCTEGVFVSVKGVERVEQGWIASVAPRADYAEAVIVHYDPQVVSEGELVAVHVASHSSTSEHAMRKKYRSAVYAFSDSAADRYRFILEALKKSYPGLITEVLPFDSFRASLPQHLDYFRSDPDRPFCRRYIVPKLSALKRTYPALF